MKTLSKKQWWIVGVAVPISVAIIAIVPSLFAGGGAGGDVNQIGETLYINSGPGNQFHDVAFNSFNLILGEASSAGIEVSQDAKESLRQAMRLVEQQEFRKAIPLFESVYELVPTAALLGNIGAAKLAAGDREEGRRDIARASARSPRVVATRHNLDLLTGPTRPSSIEGIQCELIRFEPTGGGDLVTLEIRLHNSRTESSSFTVVPNDAHLFDESTGAETRPSTSSRSFHWTSTPSSLTLAPGEEYVCWWKFTIPEPRPEVLTLVWEQFLPRPWEGLVLGH